MKFEWFVSWRYLKNRKGTVFLSAVSVLAILGLAVGVGTVAVVLAVMNGFDKELEEKITGKWIGRNSKVLDLIQVEEEMAYDVIAIAAAASGIGLRRNFRKSRNC